MKAAVVRKGEGTEQIFRMAAIGLIHEADYRLRGAPGWSCERAEDQHERLSESLEAPDRSARYAIRVGARSEDKKK